MPNSNRGNRSAAWLVALIGIALAGYAVFFGLSEQSRYIQKADQAASEYAAHAANEVKEGCRAVVTAEKPQCLADAQTKYELKRRDNRREYDDLIAQQKSALWTGIMGMAAITGMILSVVGVYLVYVTFDETRKSNVISERAAEAAQREAQETRDAYVLAERAVVRIKSFAVGFDTFDWWSVEIAISDLGRSNAHRFRLDYSVQETQIFPHDLKFSENIDTICQPDEGTTTLDGFRLRKPRNFPVYIIGSLTYSTVWEARFKTFFCFLIAGPVPFSDSSGNHDVRWLDRVPAERMPRDT